MQTPCTAAVDLYWIPLGAGGRCVRANGRGFEAIEAARQRRPRRDLYHAVLVVDIGHERHTIELAPSPDGDETSRGVVATGAVGNRRLGRLRLFRYEVRCWRDGCIPDRGRRWAGRSAFRATPASPATCWTSPPSSRSRCGVATSCMPGEMWNSNSVIAWLEMAAGLTAGELRPPAGGRAPGWDAGLEVARRIGSAPRRSSPRGRPRRRSPAVR